MIYITRNLKPAPECTSVNDNILPPLMLFKLFVVACPTFGFFVVAETADPIYGLALFRAGSIKLSQVFLLHFKIF